MSSSLYQSNMVRIPKIAWSFEVEMNSRKHKVKRETAEPVHTAVTDPGFPIGVVDLVGAWTPEAVMFPKFCMSK